MNNIRRPSELLHSFQCTFAIKNSTQPVIVKPFIILIRKHKLSFKKIFIFEEIDLEPCIGERSNFDLEREILIVNRDIDT